MSFMQTSQTIFRLNHKFQTHKCINSSLPPRTNTTNMLNTNSTPNTKQSIKTHRIIMPNRKGLIEWNIYSILKLKNPLLLRTLKEESRALDWLEKRNCDSNLYFSANMASFRKCFNRVLIKMYIKINILILSSSKCYGRGGKSTSAIN